MNSTPLQLALWAIPSAIAAFFIHGARLLLLDRKSGAGGNDHAPLALCSGRSDVRGHCAAERDRSSQSETLRECARSGA